MYGGIKLTLIIALFAAAGFFVFYKDSAQAQLKMPEYFSVQGDQSQNYYPSAAHIKMSDYYIFPDKTVRVLGFGFWPGETVNIIIFGQTFLAKANAGGNFTGPAVKVPFGAVNSTQTALAAGSVSGAGRSAQFVVGNYYPVVKPSKWFLAPGNSVSFSGYGFAPNEPVEIWNSGQKVSTVKASSLGRIITPAFKVPNSTGLWQFGFKGSRSNSMLAVNTTISPEK